jgi:surface polysaccharide O-acyltransferase-like enzyme
LDLLRVLSILAVIMIHTSTKVLQQSAFGFTFTLFLNQISRFAVPVFFFVSGYALNLNYTNIKEFYQKRLSRIIVPYLFWTVFYLLFVYPDSLLNLPRHLLTGSASYQFYFIPTLLIYYLIFPFVRRVNSAMLLILFIVQICVLFYDYYFQSLPFVYPVSVLFLNFFIFIFGIFQSHRNFHFPKNIPQIFTPILALIIFYQGFTNYLTTNNYLAYYSQWRPIILFYAILFIGLISNLTITKFDLIKLLSRLSFFVFFIHVFILEAVWKIFIFNDLVLFTVVTFISFLLAFLVSKIPYLSKLTS